MDTAGILCKKLHFSSLLFHHIRQSSQGDRVPQKPRQAQTLVTETKITVLLLRRFLTSHWYQELKATPEYTKQLFFNGSQHLTCWDGPPTPLTGPANPAGACGMGAPAGTPLPAALPTPGPPAAPARGTRAIPV